MNKNIAIVVLVIILIGVIVWIWLKPRKTEAPVDEEGWTLSASFICKDGKHFIAEFPNEENKVNIIVDGITTRSLPGKNNFYEDMSYAYAFAGEGVTVNYKYKRTMTTCSQLRLNLNNAPVNFGDAE